MLYGNQNGSNNREYLSDVLSIASFIVGLANYGENLDQRSAQDLLDKQTKEIHEHLKMQDEKIDKIIKMLGGGKDGI